MKDKKKTDKQRNRSEPALNEVQVTKMYSIKKKKRYTPNTEPLWCEKLTGIIWQVEIMSGKTGLSVRMGKKEIGEKKGSKSVQRERKETRGQLCCWSPLLIIKDSIVNDMCVVIVIMMECDTVEILEWVGNLFARWGCKAGVHGYTF